jgi:hypothetical protein
MRRPIERSQTSKVESPRDQHLEIKALGGRAVFNSSTFDLRPPTLLSSAAEPQPKSHGFFPRLLGGGWTATGVFSIPRSGSGPGEGVIKSC